MPFRDLSPLEAAKWIHEAGGLALIAHPGRFANGQFAWHEAMPALKEMGLDGFEAYYGDYSENQERYFLSLAEQLDMLPAGGSDFHGTLKPHLQLGVGRGRMKIPLDVLDQLDAHKAKRLKSRP